MCTKDRQAHVWWQNCISTIYTVKVRKLKTVKNRTGRMRQFSSVRSFKEISIAHSTCLWKTIVFRDNSNHTFQELNTKKIISQQHQLIVCHCPKLQNRNLKNIYLNLFTQTTNNSSNYTKHRKQHRTTKERLYF